MNTVIAVPLRWGKQRDSAVDRAVASRWTTKVGTSIWCLGFVLGGKIHVRPARSISAMR